MTDRKPQFAVERRSIIDGGGFSYQWIFSDAENGRPIVIFESCMKTESLSVFTERSTIADSMHLESGSWFLYEGSLRTRTLCGNEIGEAMRFVANRVLSQSSQASPADSQW